MGHRCCNKLKVKRGLWSPEEDEKLLTHITTHGHGNWSSVPKLAGLQRCGKSCRLRWINYLRPDLRKGSFTQEEEQIIIDVHRILGNRTDNEVKNFWNSCIKKKLMSQGLDPQTHNLMTSSSHHQNKSQNNKNFSSSFVVISQNNNNVTKPIPKQTHIFTVSNNSSLHDHNNEITTQNNCNNMLTLPSNNNTTPIFTTFNYDQCHQNPNNNNDIFTSNTTSTTTTPNYLSFNMPQNPSQYDNSITTPTISSSSSLNIQCLSRPGLLDDIGLCGSSFDLIQASKMLPENDILQQTQPPNYQNQGQDHDKVWEMEMGDKDRNYDDDSNFDLGFMESNFNLSGVMCHDLSSMEYDLAWNY
ncbi:hypothetical protein G4B88_028869 [Cannabis sativa]|uniref:Uncharacterized protein n=2 Tax=Cannabis sativa TaxID=3483 RepID=A0A7J6HNG4_CANSA|nr:hypothetical protein G4B88_028869 [Cannabis sativa]